MKVIVFEGHNYGHRRCAAPLEVLHLSTIQTLAPPRDALVAISGPKKAMPFGCAGARFVPGNEVLLRSGVTRGNIVN